ncbi:Cnl2/NKP2 family protein-domain-containing protein [Xylogone sp. PMI_703]|nr:Cnl2/NKP2 family protein-domain-containing protein [Xylogone sp. PMI_703]
MAPTEATILSTFLLPPAPLPTIITLKSFTELFPRSQQSSPQIRSLYRDLQHQRAHITDNVTRNITEEVKRGNVQRRAVVRARRSAERAGDEDDEVEIERALFGSTSNLPASRPVTLTSILPELEKAIADMESELQKLDEEAEELIEDTRGIVGDLSDLRYGRLSNAQLHGQVLEGLDRLEATSMKK